MICANREPESHRRSLLAWVVIIVPALVTNGCGDHTIGGGVTNIGGGLKDIGQEVRTLHPQISKLLEEAPHESKESAQN